jgi:hypothetical protein
MDTSELNVNQLIIAWAWPLTTLLLLAFVFRATAASLVASLAERVARGGGLKLGVAGFSVELPSSVVEPVKQGLAGVNVPIASEVNAFSSDRSAIEELIRGDAVEVISLDLGAGRKGGFLTSRLFLTARLMARQRRTKVVAFTYSSGARAELYLGACLLEDVDRALVDRFPEYEAAFAQALQEGWWRHGGANVVLGGGNWAIPPGSGEVISALGETGRFKEDDAARVIGAFLEAVQYRPPAPMPTPPTGWVWLESVNVYERAEWVTAEWLRGALAGALMLDRVHGKTQTAETVVKGRSDYVGVVDNHERLLEVVSKREALEEVVRARLLNA